MAKAQKSKSAKADEKGGSAAAVVRRIVEIHGGKRTVATKLDNVISRPLLVAICQGKKPTTPATIAALTKVCTKALAEELIAAHLSDETTRIEVIRERLRQEG